MFSEKRIREEEEQNALAENFMIVTKESQYILRESLFEHLVTNFIAGAVAELQEERIKKGLLPSLKKEEFMSAVKELYLKYPNLLIAGEGEDVYFGADIHKFFREQNRMASESVAPFVSEVVEFYRSVTKDRIF